jgi:phosphate uptake regulator
MVEQRKVQKVSHSTLSVTIPREMARELGIAVGDSLIFRVEADGTLRLIPVGSAKESSRVMLRADGLSEDMLSRLIVGSYALGYDVIEVIRQEPFDRAVLDRTTAEMNRLKGLEVVESTDRRIVAQNFSDPTKFPVDSLIKRLQMQVSRSLDNIIEAVDLKKTGSLNEVARVKNEINELYWLIVRQLLVALNRRELASEIGLESPLHASGDRLVAKTLDEIGRIIIEIADELVRLKSRGVKMDAKMAGDIRRLAWMAREAFNVTVEGLLAPDVKLVERASSLVRQTSDLEKELTHGMLETGEHGYARMLVSYFGQLARYCNIIIEISSHRLLRKTSRVASVQRR